MDALWVLEEYLAGRSPQPGRVAEWFASVAEWVLELGAGRVEWFVTARGGPTNPGSRSRQRAGVCVRPSRPRSTPSAAFVRGRSTATSSARTCSSARGVGVIDWEHAYEDGPPASTCSSSR